MSNLSICHIHSVKNTSNVSVQNETYFLPDLLLSVYLSEQHLLPLSWRTSCSSLPPPHPWSNHSKALLILSLNICLLRPLPFGSTALRLFTSITFCQNKGLLTDLTPLSPHFSHSNSSHPYKIPNWQCALLASNSPEASYDSQNTSHTSLHILASSQSLGVCFLRASQSLSPSSLP